MFGVKTRSIIIRESDEVAFYRVYVCMYCFFLFISHCFLLHKFYSVWIEMTMGVNSLYHFNGFLWIFFLECLSPMFSDTAIYLWLFIYIIILFIAIVELPWMCKLVTYSIFLSDSNEIHFIYLRERERKKSILLFVFNKS